MPGHSFSAHSRLPGPEPSGSVPFCPGGAGRTGGPCAIRAKKPLRAGRRVSPVLPVRPPAPLQALRCPRPVDSLPCTRQRVYRPEISLQTAGARQGSGCVRPSLRGRIPAGVSHTAFMVRAVWSVARGHLASRAGTLRVPYGQFLRVRTVGTFVGTPCEIPSKMVSIGIRRNPV
jgi:hypothetical protein